MTGYQTCKLLTANVLCACILAAPATFADAPAQLGEISVTGTPQVSAAPDPTLPVTVITAEDLKAWGVSDLADVLSLVAGTTPARGGDGGPAGLMPGLVGAREADDYLLVVDGVPQGATTVPPFESITLTDVERIEVRRGPDAVIYGSAAFAGAIYIYHYPAGQSSQSVSAHVGSYGSHGADAALALPALGDLSQSLSATVSHDGYSDPRSKADRYQLFYRASAPLGGGAVALDAGLLDLQQLPMSPTPVTDQGLDPGVPLDTNQNPAGAELNEYRSQLTLTYVRQVAGGDWDSTLAFTHLSNPVVQGFLTDDPDEPGENAEGYSEGKRLNETYLDSHWHRDWSPDFGLTLGANDMSGEGNAHTTSFGYTASLGPAAPSSVEDVDDASYARDARNFFGAYAQSRWRFTPAFTLDLGLRENITDENRYTDDADDGPDTDTQRNTRLSASAMLRWRAFDEGQDSVTPYLAYANTFQPSQFDFSPDPDDAAFLQPETARSWQLGARGSAGELDWELSTARVDFGNAVVAVDAGGVPGFVNGGSDSFRDVDLDLGLRLSEDLRFTFSYEYVDARYLDYNFVDDAGDNLQLAGKRLPFTPDATASLGAVYGGQTGFSAAFSAQYQGRRYLDPQNLAPATGFVSYDARVAYGFGRWSLYLDGENLSDRRDPVLASEIGDGQVYRMFARSLELGIVWKL